MIMKIFKKFITIFVIILFFFGMSLAYSPVEKDFQIAERIENNLYEKIENNQNLLPEEVVDKLIFIQNNKNLSSRALFILDIIIEDMIHDFNLENIYSYQDMTEDDCYDDEKYDIEGKYCYIEWKENENNIEEYYDKNFQINQDNDEWEGNIEARYGVFENNITLLNWLENQEHREVWEMFSYIVPKNYRVDFIEYVVSNNPDSDTYAHVQQNSEDYTKWELHINRSAFYDTKGNLIKKESLHTLIHEFAHVLTLNKSQVQYYPLDAPEYTLWLYQDRCNNNSISEWCLYKASYLNNFINTFWEEDFRKIKNAQEWEEFDFYTNSETNFVTDYASTNPGEDIAETFTYFVLGNKPEYTTIANQKVLQLYEYPELIHLKNLIQGRILKLSK